MLDSICLLYVRAYLYAYIPLMTSWFKTRIDKLTILFQAGMISIPNRDIFYENHFVEAINAGILLLGKILSQVGY